MHGSAVKCEIWNLGAGGKRQNLYQWKPTSNSWSEFILYMPAVQEPWHLSCQSSFTFTHSSSFQSQCDNSSMLSSIPSSCVVFLSRVGGWGSLDVTSRWQMVPHWDVGRRIYGRGRMLILNLRRCTVLPPSAISPFCHSWSPRLSVCCFVCSLVFVCPLCPITSLCPSSYSLPLSLSPSLLILLFHCLCITLPFSCGVTVQHNCVSVHMEHGQNNSNTKTKY